ncbi:MAG: DNA recombination protein RmuC [Candidatus Cloacimonadia bacterium]
MNVIMLMILMLVLQVVMLIVVLVSLKKRENSGNEEVFSKIALFENTLQRYEGVLKDELTRSREESNRNSQNLREETGKTSSTFQDSFFQRMNEFAERLERMRGTIAEQLKELRDENSKKLDEMRGVVDEKLQTTLEKRLNESFKQVSERLEQVHQGLGDMKNLAADVGGLKNVLSNVKTRGIMGEYQLKNILDQLFASSQYEEQFNVKQKGDSKVDFAIKLPGRDKEQEFVYLPIDAKFPMEDYYALQDAYETGDKVTIDDKRKKLADTVKAFAKSISEKYIHPPITTDFALLFLPAEGIYAEVLGRTDVVEQIRRDYKVTITGPTTLTALLNSLQMGFQTLAIEKRSSEVWKTLGMVKTQFESFADLLAKTQKGITAVGDNLELMIGRRTRAINRALRGVEALPVNEVLELEVDSAQDDEDDSNGDDK